MDKANVLSGPILRIPETLEQYIRPGFLLLLQRHCGSVAGHEYCAEMLPRSTISQLSLVEVTKTPHTSVSYLKKKKKKEKIATIHEVIVRTRYDTHKNFSTEPDTQEVSLLLINCSLFHNKIILLLSI